MNLLDELGEVSNLRSAWRSLHKNPKSYGIDDVTIDEFRDNLDGELAKLSESIKTGTYKPDKLRGHPLEKGKSSSSASDKTDYRILKIPTVRDRVVQKAIEQLIITPLDNKYSINNNGVSFAYVKDGGVKNAAKKVKAYYKKGYIYVYVADIEKFFDNVNNKLLIEKIEAALPDNSLIPLLKEFLKIDIKNKEELKERTQQEYIYNPLVGIAQGSPLSPLFANVFLADFDKKIKSKSKNYKVVRYADDIAVLCKTEDLAISAHTLVEAELKKLKLKVRPLLVQGDLPEEGHEKHSIVRKYSGLLFLGLRFTGDKIYPSGTSYNNAIWTVRRAAYNRRLSFAKKLTSIDARIEGWCSAYGFTDYLDEPTIKNDRLVEDVLTKVLRKAGLRTRGGTSAMKALGIEGYKVRLNKHQTKSLNKRTKPQYQ